MHCCEALEKDPQAFTHTVLACLMLASDYSEPVIVRGPQRPEGASSSRPLSRPLHPPHFLTARTQLPLPLQGREWWWSHLGSFVTCFLGKLSSLKKEGGGSTQPSLALFNPSLWLLLEEILLDL